MKKSILVAMAALLLTIFEESQAFVRIIPVFHEHTTGAWSILLTKNPETNTWSTLDIPEIKAVFFSPAEEQQAAPKQIAQALPNKSNGLFNSNNTIVSQMASCRGGHDANLYYFVLVTEKLTPQNSRWFLEYEVADDPTVSVEIQKLFPGLPENPGDLPVHTAWNEIKDILTELAEQKISPAQTTAFAYTYQVLLDALKPPFNKENIQKNIQPLENVLKEGEGKIKGRLYRQATTLVQIAQYEISPKNTPYKSLLAFIADKNPHQPTVEEALIIASEYENVYLAKRFTEDIPVQDKPIEGVNIPHDPLSISYAALKNEDGSPLTSQQKNVIKKYLHDEDPNSTSFRFSDSNLEVLTILPGTQEQNNPVWRYVHRYLREFPYFKNMLQEKEKKAPAASS